MSAFLEDDPEIAIHGEDLAWPFALDTAGDLAVLRGVPNTESALIARVTTTRGEIAHRPDYGIDFAEFRNGPAMDVERGRLRARIALQVAREDRIENQRVIVAPNANETRTYARIFGDPRTGGPGIAVAAVFGA